MTPTTWIWAAKGLVALVVAVAVMAAVNNYTNMAGEIAEQKQLVKVLEGRLAGAHMRIDRRDQAINALPDRCKVQALEWVKTGDIPSPYNPFESQR